MLAETFPDETAEGLKGRLDAYINNGLLGAFCKAHPHLGFGGCNSFERYLGNEIMIRHRDIAKLYPLCRDLVMFGRESKIEERFRDNMVRRNRHKSVRPLPCECGSMNLRFWRKPSKVVCHDCGRFFQPPQQPSGQALVQSWNAYRLAKRHEVEQYSG